MIRYPNLRVGDLVRIKRSWKNSIEEVKVFHIDELYVRLPQGSSWYVESDDELYPPTIQQLLLAFLNNPSNERLNGQLIHAFKYGDL